MTEAHNIELKKLIKKYGILKKIEHILLYYGILMFFLLLLEEFGVLDLPFYESRLVISLRVFLNTWVGIPIIFIEKKMKKINTRIREIESMYEKKSPDNTGG